MDPITRPQAALMTSGILTVIQVIRIKFCCGYTLGTGLISVMGTSFTFLPLAREIVTSEIKAGKSGMDAYGASESITPALVRLFVCSFVRCRIEPLPQRLRN